MKKILAKNYYLQIFLVFVLCLITFFILGSNKKTPRILEYKGAVLTHIHDIGSGYGSIKSKKMQDYIKSIGYNSVQLNTFGYMKSSKHTEVLYKVDPTMSKDLVSKEIKLLKSKGFKVMLKPHIWIGNLEFDPDNWRNKIDFNNEKELNLWFKNYRDFILYEAKIAEEHDVEIFVIATELVELTKYDNRWRDLIKSVRSVYNGKLTYAAEGLKAENISFWDDLDYIGIDAYFPLSNNVNPSLEELNRGWNKYKKQLSALSKKYNKEIIFTEIGYKSVEGTSIRPWEWLKDGKLSQTEQLNCYKATFEFVNDNPYIAGLFIWKYFTDMNNYEKGNNEKGFTPYGKKSEKIISEFFNSH